MHRQAAAYERQRGVLTIATGTWSGRGGLQDASLFGRASPALKIDRAIAGLERIKQLSVQCQYTIRTPMKGSKSLSPWVVYEAHYNRTAKFKNCGVWLLPSLHRGA
jgi:hypothetical protein